MIKTILTYVIVLFILIVIARIISSVAKPVINDTKPDYDNFVDYMTDVYCPNRKCKNSKNETIDAFPRALIVFNRDLTSAQESDIETFDKIEDFEINIPNTLRYFNYIYDNGPRSILDEYPLAENLSFSWPPKLGSRYKLTAFPYPKSSFILSAVFDTISNTVDAYTFPGWMIQRRNPLDFNNSIYNNNYFRPYQDVEVLHACYPPPGYDFPYCDDGGYWLYLSVGSGVFWNTGNCVVSLNKISLLYDLYNCSLKKRNSVARHNKINPKNQLPLPAIYGYSIQDMVDKMHGKGGGTSIMIAIFSIVDSLTHHTGTTKIVGFKNNTPSDSGGAAWDNFISRSFLIFYLIAVTMIQIFINLKNKTTNQKIVIILFGFIIITALIYVFLFGIGENFFRGLGWMTLDMALEETNMSLYQFVEECALGTQRNNICNSLATTQLFDLDTEIFTYALGYDSFILTSQPNKTGTWEVEICDLRKFDLNNLIQKGGICGGYKENNIRTDSNRVTKCDVKDMLAPSPSPSPSPSSDQGPGPSPSDNKYILTSGPITFDSTGPPYFKPTSECECVDGPDRLTISCKGFLSEKLGMNK